MASTIRKTAKRSGKKPARQAPGSGGGAPAAARGHGASASPRVGRPPQGLVGLFRSAPEEIDTIVEDAMRERRVQSWRPSWEDFAALEALAAETGRTLNELLNDAVRLLLRQRGRR